MDAAAKAFQDKVNAALRYPFRFHKVNKLCICVGSSDRPRKDYRELLGVADKHYPDFDFHVYSALAQIERTQLLEKMTKDVFWWLLGNFDDADFVLTGANNLGWREFSNLKRKSTDKKVTDSDA